MMIIAIDFDGTCVSHEYPKIGKDIGAVPVLRWLIDQGHKLILWTIRCNNELNEAVEWFYSNDIPLYGINKNPNQFKWTSSPKAYAHIYIDDAAMGCPLLYNISVSSRPYANWEKLKIWLTLALNGHTNLIGVDE